MKVLHIIEQLGIGGAEKQLYELIIQSDPSILTHEVIYYNHSLDNEAFKLYDRAGIRYQKIPKNRKRPIRFLNQLSGAIRRLNPDIVHCWLAGAALWGRLAAIRAGQKRIIVGYRGGCLRYPLIFRVLEWLTHNRVFHLSNSWACANMTAAKVGLDPACFEVIYNGVDLAKYQISIDKKRFRAELGIPDNVSLITMVGRLTEAKNYPMLLRTARRCREKNLGAHFVIVGHGEKEAELKVIAESLGVRERVHFLGLRTDVPEILAVSDIFCYTSNWEGFPNALLEAMASGLPVITTDFDGAKELVAGPDVGTVVPRNDVEAAVTAIERYLEDPAQTQTIGQNAQRFVQSTFSISRMVKRTIQFYQRLMDDK